MHELGIAQRILDIVRQHVLEAQAGEVRAITVPVGELSGVMPDAEHRLFACNVASSPGAGKAILLERAIEQLKGRLRVAVVEGDVQTDFDAQRVARHGVPVVQIVTNGGCHREARLVQDALANLDLAAVDLLVIENAGDLVCPAGYDLGEALEVVVLSTTEGDDKPLTYPVMFRNASVRVINKIDLLPYVDCGLGTLTRHACQVNPALTVFETSCTTRAGIPACCEWLEAQVAVARA